VVTIKKKSLLEAGALKQDQGLSKDLLTSSNLDEAALMRLSRTIATVIGLPESTAFCGFHPAKLFDFSTRARCLAAFRALGVRGGGAEAGAVVAADVEVHPYLREEESKWFERNLSASLEAVAKLEKEQEELREAIKDLSSTVEGALNAAAEQMAAFSMVANKRPSEQLMRRESSGWGVDDDEWGDDDTYGQTVSSNNAAEERRRAEVQASYGVSGGGGGGGGAAGEARQRDEEMEIKKAQLEAYEKALEELAIKAETQRGFVAANQAKKAEWADKVARYQGGMAAPVPVLPVGDTLLEPFWPQGLGSNRGFHSALDAVWAVHVMETDGLEAALLERNFWYDLMLQGPWQPGMLLKQANGWSADPVTRYADGAILRTKSNYTNPQSRRLFRGAGATPARIAALDIRAERGADGTNIFR
jgi:hypothetical protein